MNRVDGKQLQITFFAAFGEIARPVPTGLIHQFSNNVVIGHYPARLSGEKPGSDARL